VGFILKSIILCFICLSLATSILDINGGIVKRSSLIRPALNQETTTLWARVDGNIFCQASFDNESTTSLLKKMVDSRIGIIYLVNVDIQTCSNYLQKIAEKLHQYDLLLAMNIGTDFDINQIYSNNYTVFNPDYFTTKLQDTKGVTDWVSYLVFDNALSYYTYAERREIQSRLRDIYDKSFIGFHFTMSVTPTPDNNHPIRQTAWNQFLPDDDDGDFIITSIPVTDFKRTIVISEGINIKSAEGQLLDSFSRI
jgi:hypothetical protein